MTKSKEEQIFIQIGEKLIELKGADKEAFLAQREADRQTKLLLELSVRKEIVNDTRGKVNRILIDEKVEEDIVIDNSSQTAQLIKLQ
jgi:hypothetical protein